MPKGKKLPDALPCHVLLEAAALAARSRHFTQALRHLDRAYPLIPKGSTRHELLLKMSQVLEEITSGLASWRADVVAQMNYEVGHVRDPDFWHNAEPFKHLALQPKDRFAEIQEQGDETRKAMW
jgi:hypothetical protein